MKNSKEKVIKNIYRQQTVNRIDKKIKLLGVNCHYNAINILNSRLLISSLIFILVFIFVKYGFFLSPILAIGYWILDEYVTLDKKIKDRSMILDKQAIFFFEILVISLETGKDIINALDDTVKSIDNELSLEFKKTLEEITVGKNFQDAIKTMKERIPSDAINNVLMNISQSTLFGNDVIESLSNQIEYLSNKRISDIKSYINKLPIKISVISVIFFIPIIMILIIGPIIIKLLG